MGSSAVKARCAALVPEVVELEWHAELAGAQERDHRLQLVAALAGDAQLLALNGGLRLQLAVLDAVLELARHFRVDALAQRDLLLGLGEIRLRFLDLQAVDV